MLYGLGIPMLFPVACIYMVIASITEKMMLGWVVRQPPAMDDALTTNALGMIKYAPLFLLANGWWMIGNRQIFEGNWSYINNDLTPMKSKHFLWPQHVDMASPLLLMAISGITLTLIQTFFHDKLAEWGFTLQRNEIEVDEDLPNFFEVVKLSQADMIVKEAENMKENYLVEIEDPRVVKVLDETK
jgi:hypothetical protein